MKPPYLQKPEISEKSHLSWETCMQLKKQRLEPDMEQWAGFK